MSIKPANMTKRRDKTLGITPRNKTCPSKLTPRTSSSTWTHFPTTRAKNKTNSCFAKRSIIISITGDNKKAISDDGCSDQSPGQEKGERIMRWHAPISLVVKVSHVRLNAMAGLSNTSSFNYLFTPSYVHWPSLSCVRPGARNSAHCAISRRKVCRKDSSNVQEHCP